MGLEECPFEYDDCEEEEEDEEESCMISLNRWLPQ